ncbi:PqqD family peptide modification chaperone [Mesorhizobium sp.]|uniref:PqqD family peptide modification chaperone n=1 Tax=Mesorhizobium sp. TaxID=1871066 RepID=UPI000FE36FE8|nr:PqqD family peptide modification chaperone [Mesorhizobium sp.]RWA77250.1 MAG: PqqD family peptide modification chaperone [Mesorhizobium sp.]RWC01120.1 MAG: PqqD family peptide modification chaperone [Mesorhizobium sp.]RWG84882.1 MAG: PqqD family peptide modification chaperone [Mesorhizobium sp.]RWG90128.1 MAG: PqqD family peptide modification chaperone [Mesorhizobium sp.]RWK05067.1 MAG: PqqD family peptide modification chaperone [Mesorhizobium sp.]
MKHSVATVAPGATDCGPATFVVQARLARVGGQNILFSPSRQAIFAVNDTAAEIWRSLEEGTPPQAISLEMARSGVDSREANRHVETALEDWQRLSLIRPCAPSPPSSAQELVSQVVAIAGLCIRIVYPAACAFPAITVFRHLEVQRETADILLQMVEQGGRVHLFRNGDWVLSCSPDELPVMLKGQLLTEVLDHGAYELAVHAAALVRNKRMVLVCGNPGAGKTTLTMALVHAGFGFASDDVTLLDSNGHGVGLPFAPAVKAGAWPLLAEYCPDLYAVPVSRRPDRRRVRFAMPGEFVPLPPSPTAIGYVVLLRRSRDSKAGLEPVDPAGALRGLLNGAFSPGRELSGAAFDVLTQIIGSAQAYRLTYSGLDDAAELITRACL